MSINKQTGQLLFLGLLLLIAAPSALARFREWRTYSNFASHPTVLEAKDLSQKYPKAPDIALDAAIASNSREQLDLFISTFPSHPRLTEAKSKRDACTGTEEQQAWRNLSSAPSCSLACQYAYRYKDGAHLSEVRSMLFDKYMIAKPQFIPTRDLLSLQGNALLVYSNLQGRYKSAALGALSGEFRFAGLDVQEVQLESQAHLTVMGSSQANGAIYTITETDKQGVARDQGLGRRAQGQRVDVTVSFKPKPGTPATWTRSIQAETPAHFDVKAGRDAVERATVEVVSAAFKDAFHFDFREPKT